MPNNSRILHQPAEGCDSSAHRPAIDTKRLGEIAEMAFILKATSLHLTPSRPYGERRPYDFLLECGERVLKIQVKSVFNNRSGTDLRFPVNVSQHSHLRTAAYTSNDIDFVVAYVATHNVWYVIPVDALSNRKTINLYPLGKKRAHAGLFEQYREAWHLLQAEQKRC